MAIGSRRRARSPGWSGTWSLAPRPPRAQRGSRWSSSEPDGDLEARSVDVLAPSTQRTQRRTGGM